MRSSCATPRTSPGSPPSTAYSTTRERPRPWFVTAERRRGAPHRLALRRFRTRPPPRTAPTSPSDERAERPMNASSSPMPSRGGRAGCQRKTPSGHRTAAPGRRPPGGIPASTLGSAPANPAQPAVPRHRGLPFARRVPRPRGRARRGSRLRPDPARDEPASSSACAPSRKPTEVARLRAAQAVTDAAFAHIVAFMRPGMTEREVQIELEGLHAPPWCRGPRVPLHRGRGPERREPPRRTGRHAARGGPVRRASTFGAPCPTATAPT